MIIHNDPLFYIFFGDAKTQFQPKEYYADNCNTDIMHTWPFTVPGKKLQLEQLAFLKQVHGANGISIRNDDKDTECILFNREGDFLVTNKHHLGLGIATADCLPIILFDKFKHVIAIVHAGWRGSTQGVATAAVEKMVQDFGSNIEHIRVFFGPSVKQCCYDVGQDVLEALDHYACKDDVIHEVGDKMMFDLSLFNKILLEEVGIKKNAFKLNYNVCTQCDPSFCSYRRDGEKAGRQMSVVALK